MVNILCLDQALNNTGWIVVSYDVKSNSCFFVAKGTIRFKPKPKLSTEEKLIRLESAIQQLITTHNINHCFLETVKNHVASNIVYALLCTVLTFIKVQLIKQNIPFNVLDTTKNSKLSWRAVTDTKNKVDWLAKLHEYKTLDWPKVLNEHERDALGILLGGLNLYFNCQVPNDVIINSLF
jgi:Holliday junction resolvasome RuvABC endonuclease subunit